MPTDKFISASIVVCESVLTEKTGILTAVRITDSFILNQAAAFAHFYTVTFVRSLPMDFQQHRLKIQIVRKVGTTWVTLAEAPEHYFNHHYTVLSEPVSFSLTTEFTLALGPLEPLRSYFVQAWLDGEMVVQTPLTLRRS